MNVQLSNCRLTDNTSPMEDQHDRDTGDQRPVLNTSHSTEEEDEEEVKICVDMAALNSFRPHTQVRI